MAEAAVISACGRTLELGERPWLMGIVNATPDSFSDAGLHVTVEQRLEHARSLLADGADILDVGGESAATNSEPISAEEEIARVVPLIEPLSAEGALISIDTYKPEVARAAIEAGAAIVNDVSGLRDPELADVCAESGAGLVVMHTPVAPKQRHHDPALDGRAVEVAAAFIAGRLELARAHGVTDAQLIVDPGPDFGKTPAQTVELLRDLGTFAALGRPLLMAISRKDFVGAITGRAPRARLAGTLAALGHCADAGIPQIARVHDVAAAADFLAVRAVLRGERELAADARITDELRWEPSAQAT